MHFPGSGVLQRGRTVRPLALPGARLVCAQSAANVLPWRGARGRGKVAVVPVPQSVAALVGRLRHFAATAMHFVLTLAEGSPPRLLALRSCGCPHACRSRSSRAVCAFPCAAFPRCFHTGEALKMRWRTHVRACLACAAGRRGTGTGRRRPPALCFKC